MKIGQVVAVCHDGKWGRRVKGVVTGTQRGLYITVQFQNPNTGEPIEFKARRRDDNTRRRRSQQHYKYGGWVDIDYFFPWYGVYTWKD